MTEELIPAVPERPPGAVGRATGPQVHGDGARSTMERQRFLAVIGALLALGFADCSARTERPPDPNSGSEQATDLRAGPEQPPDQNAGPGQAADLSAGSEQPPDPNAGPVQAAEPDPGSQPTPGDQPACLSNTEVIRLVRSGEQDAAIIARLTTHETCFDVSPAAMLDLRNAGVSPVVIAAMTRAAGRQDS